MEKCRKRSCGAACESTGGCGKIRTFSQEKTAVSNRVVFPQKVFQFPHGIVNYFQSLLSMFARISRMMSCRPEDASFRACSTLLML